MSNFLYEEAEGVLDRFAARITSAQFQRAYRKFKCLLLVYAYLDFSYPNKPSKKHLSWAWEDAQVAFNGYGETMLHGAILQMWSTLGLADQNQFMRAASEAFDRAEMETHREADRRYIKKYRDAPIRNPSEGFTFPSVTPVSGVKVKDWLKDEGFTPEEQGAFFALLQDRKEEAETDQTTKGNHLRLVEFTTEPETTGGRK